MAEFVASAPLTRSDSDRPVLRGWSHVVAAIAAVVLAPILIVFADGRAATVVAAVYAIGVVGVFGVSGTYHRVAWTTRRRALFRRLDHAMIFVFIAATYTPIAVSVLDRSTATALLVVVWIGAAVGIAIRLLWLSAPTWVIVLPYLLVGWSVLPVVDEVWRGIGVAGFVLLLVGGGLYTLGAIVYASKRPNPSRKWFGYHEVFHALVIAAVSVHYVAVAFFALPQAA